MDVQGTVTNITNAGAFIAFGAQKDGLLSSVSCKARDWDVRVGDKITGLAVGHVDMYKNRVTLHFAGGEGASPAGGKGRNGMAKGDGKRTSKGKTDPGKAGARARPEEGKGGCQFCIGDAVAGVVKAVTIQGASLDIRAGAGTAWLPDGSGGVDVRTLRVGDLLEDLVVDAVDRRSSRLVVHAETRGRPGDDREAYEARGGRTAAWKATTGAVASAWMEDGTGGTFGRDERD